MQVVGIKVNMFYSIPTCYMHSLHKSNVTWTTMKTDFFPYASKQQGYFTSRPTLKYQSRKPHGFLWVITIYGTQERCSTACQKIMEIMQQESNATNRGEIPLKILAHNNLIGRIIGKNGNTIKRIMEQTEAKFAVSRSYVAFGPTRRDIGTSAKNKFITHLKNTVTSFKHLVGKNFKDPTLNYELSYLPYAVHVLPNGSVGVKVSYLGHDVLFTVPQITAMLMTKLKQITEASIGVKMTDCVISVPVFFTDIDRRTMLDICKIAGLNVLRLLNEPAAVALAYGFYRQDLSGDKPKKVAFVDIGHSAIQTSVCEFCKGRLKILACTWDYCLGGRDIDNCMVRYFSEEFKTKYNLNVLSNNRAIVRLLQECEKLKTQLSANPHVLPLNIECFMDDLDVSSNLERWRPPPQ